jgi:hypothetical protein
MNYLVVIMSGENIGIGGATDSLHRGEVEECCHAFKKRIALQSGETERLMEQT